MIAVLNVLPTHTMNAMNASNDNNSQQLIVDNSLDANCRPLMRPNCSHIDINSERVVDITIGSRKSNLALIQSRSVIKLLNDFYGNKKFNFIIKTMTTTGDNILNIALSKIGEKALFTRELEDELLDNKIHLIVHSLKDLPTSLPKGCIIAAVTKREDPSDALVLKEGLKLENGMNIMDILKTCDESSHLGTNSGTIGTSSLRRIAQLKHLNCKTKVSDIRGNLETRLSKLDDPSSSYSALILASAGLKRADYTSRISMRLVDDWYHAVGQGALAVECRHDNAFIIDLLKPLIDIKTTFECIAERTFMQQLEGGCSVPIGVKCVWNEGYNCHYSKDMAFLTLYGIVLSLDGSQKVQNNMTIDLNQNSITELNHLGPMNYTGVAFNCLNDDNLENMFKNSALLGYNLAQNLISLGAKDLLDRKA